MKPKSLRQLRKELGETGPFYARKVALYPVGPDIRELPLGTIILVGGRFADGRLVVVDTTLEGILNKFVLFPKKYETKKGWELV